MAEATAVPMHKSSGTTDGSSKTNLHTVDDTLEQRLSDLLRAYEEPNVDFRSALDRQLHCIRSKASQGGDRIDICESGELHHA